MKLKSLAPLLLLMASGLLSMFAILSDPGQVLIWRGGAFSDLLISHWPNVDFIRQSLETWGQVPLWNSTILSGAPLAADPLAGMWYPPAWVSIVIPAALGFNLLIWLHLAWAGIGTWRLGLRLGMRPAGALLAGLAFSATPKLLGHVGLGHVSLVYAVSWTPWALLAAEAAARSLSDSRRRRVATAARAGALTGIVFLADPRWYPGLMLLTAAFFLCRAAHSQRDTRGIGKTGGAVGRARRVSATGASAWAARAGRPVLALALGGAMSLAVAAALALPLTEFVRLSTRASLELGQSTELSLPVNRLSGLLAPELGGWPEWQPYSGSVVLFLAGLALLGDARRWRFWLGLVLLSLLTALGSNTPFYGLLRALVPGISQLRVPPRSLLLASFGLALLAGTGFDQLHDLPRSKVRSLAGALIVTYVAFGIANWASSAGTPPQERVIRVIPWAISGALIAMVGVWTGSGIAARLSPGPFATFVGAILLMDLVLVNRTTLKPQLVGSDTVVERVGASLAPGQRVFSPSYSLTQPAAAIQGLQLADGVNPLQLASYRRFMDRAIGITESGYSVTLPPFPNGNTLRPWGFDPDPELLGMLAVSEVVSAYPVAADGLELRDSVDGQFVYQNTASRPRAWLETAEGVAPVTELDWSPNSITVRASGPGRLVLSEIDYPGWRAQAGEQQLSIIPYAGLLRSVELQPGPQVVVFSFQPSTVLAGAVISMIGLLATASLWLRR